MSFTAPAWLFGLAALAVPIAIHLWSRGRRRFVRVASLRLFRAESSRRARRIRPTRWWLLALRCGLLAAIVAALAGPRIAGWGVGEGGRDWVLVHPELVSRRAVLEEHDPAAYRQLEGWLDADVTRRWLAPGLPPAAASLERPPALEGRTAVWSLLREADEAAPPAATLRVASPDRLAALAGRRPALAREVEWLAVRDPEENRWIERAAWSSAGELEVLTGRSAGSRTVFARAAPTEIAVGEAPDAVEVRLLGTDPLAADDRVTLPPSSPRLRVALLYDPDRREDLGFLQAGVAAAATAAAVTLDLVTLELGGAGEEAAAAESGVVFRLGGGPVGADLLRAVESGSTLVTDALGPYEACVGVADLPEAPVSGPVAFDRCGPVERDGRGHALWRDRQGRVLLEGEPQGAGRWLRFRSRWNPRWSELVHHPAFPHWLAGVLQAGAGGTGWRSAARADSDRRAAGVDQLAPRRAQGDGERPPHRGYDPSWWLWASAALFFAAERIVSRLRP